MTSFAASAADLPGTFPKGGLGRDLIVEVCCDPDLLVARLATEDPALRPRSLGIAI
jgi:hypothetical protein